MIGARIKAVALTGMVCTVVAWWSPVRSKEVQAVQWEVLVAFNPSSESATAADPEIPIDELKLLVKPLTKAELEKEAGAWQELLKAKVKEISDAEIAIKRQNRQAKEAKEAVDAVEKAQAALAEAKEAQENAAPDTPEYEEATKKVEAAQAALAKAREAIGEAVEAKEEVELDSEVQKTVSEALEGDSEDEDDSSEELDASEAARNIDAAAEALGEETEGVEGVDESKLEEISEQLEQSVESTSEVKKEVVKKVTELISERVAIVDRFEVLLDELEKKGGETEQYKTYIDAVSGVEIDVTDTTGLGVRLVGWLKSEEGGLRWGINIAKFVIIVAVSIYISKILSQIVNKTLSKVGGTSELLRQFIIMVIERGGIVLGVMLALTALGVSLGPLIALLGGASFVLAFALQSNLGNFASGLMIMLSKPFDVGDEIKVSGLWGYVDSISLASTKIKGFSRQVITVPNNTIWGSIIENLTAGDIRAGSILIRVPFKENIRKVKQIIEDIAKSHPLVLSDPGPGVFPWQYEEYYIALYLSFKTKTPDFWSAWGDLIPMIQEGLEKEGIEIALPIEQQIDVSASEYKQKSILSKSKGNGNSPVKRELAKSVVAEKDGDDTPFDEIDAGDVDFS